MSWTDFYRRQEILEATVRLAARNPGEPLPLEEVPGAEEHFGTEENVLTALQYQWTRTLSGRLRSEVVDPDDADGLGDHVDAVTRAWRAAVDEHTDLRAVLDGAYERHASLRRMHEGELRMLAVTAGLADPREPADEIVKVGHALEALLRANREERRRPVIGHLRRLLAPSA
ncbi:MULTISPECIES: hypothetical protein [unclassified Amycolatopsis]|uniref:hypothetical protein n=1 Tax=unclassified Amycolatopsis TaxID=2618356 RepID=UPI0028755F1D|nr:MULTISPECIES: hypothetical protein [unclassified Amycolatopsis]MDS0140198.1 hypothetical protein [Amycolatopsis sp. 505]MDS0149601.1 hypothetical protein [Amycolatopsis sp. CM201R]